MKIIGTEEELKWVKEALANNCTDCICQKACNENAVEEQKKQGKIISSCPDFLEKWIEFVLVDSEKKEEQHQKHKI